MALFRVAQEALANVRRHSDARSVRLRLRVDAGAEVELRVEDDGRGFRDPCAARSADAIDELCSLGVGIPGMRARLRPLGGSLRIETGADGTRVVAIAPLPARAATGGPGPVVGREPALQVAALADGVVAAAVG